MTTHLLAQSLEACTRHCRAGGLGISATRSRVRSFVEALARMKGGKVWVDDPEGRQQLRVVVRHQG